MIDAKIATALKRIITNQHFLRIINFEEQHAQKYERFLRGRQMAHVVYDYFRVVGAHDAVLDLSDLFSSISLYKEMSFRISIQDRTKLYNLQVKYPRNMSWRVCTR